MKLKNCYQCLPVLFLHKKFSKKFSKIIIRLQIKEAMQINWKNPELNKQVKHVGITISI